MDTRTLSIRLQGLARFCPGVTGMHPGVDPVDHLPTSGRGRTRQQAGSLLGGDKRNEGKRDTLELVIEGD